MTTPLDITDFVYNTGTLTIAPGDTTAVFDGAGLSAVIKAGDTLRAGSASGKISEVTDDAHVELFAPWDGPVVSAGPYLIIKDSPIRYDMVAAAFDTNRLLQLLDGTEVWYAVEGDEPDPSIGEEGQFALKTNVTPWNLWIKTAAVWVLQPGSPGGQGDPGEDGATWVVQAAEPGTDYPVGSLWLDADSTDLDVYQLGGSPLSWEDTGVNLKGAQGNPGLGVPAGGAAGQVLAKASVADNDTEWIDPPAGGGDVAGETHAATSKTTPVDADELPIVDSAASNVLKKLTWANLKSALATTFLTPSAVRERLTGNRTYHVSTAGSDSNDGLSSGAPFLTVTKALSVILGTLDVAGYTVTVQLADGNYSVSSIAIGAGVGIVSPASLVIRGNNATPGNVKVTGTGDVFSAISSGAVCTVLDMELSTTGSSIFRAGAGGQIFYGNIRFGSATDNHFTIVSGGYVEAAGDYTIISGVKNHINVAGGQARITGRTVTISGTPNFTTAFANCSRNGTIVIFSNTYSGSATGARFAVSGNGVIDTSGLSTTGLPGNSSPTTPYPSGGQYI